MSTEEEVKLGIIKEELISKLERRLETPCTPYGGEILHSVKDGIPQPKNKRRKAWSTVVLNDIEQAMGYGVLNWKDYRPKILKLQERFRDNQLVTDDLIKEVELLINEVLDTLKK